MYGNAKGVHGFYRVQLSISVCGCVHERAEQVKMLWAWPNVYECRDMNRCGVLYRVLCQT